MCSKCKIQCFSHKLQKISELQNFRKFLNFRKFPKKFFCPNLFFFFSKNFFGTKMFFLTIFISKNFSLLSRPLHCIKVICIGTAYLLKFHFKHPEMYKFHCFQDHYISLQISINLECIILVIPNFFQSFCTRKV